MAAMKVIKVATTKKMLSAVTPCGLAFITILDEMPSVNLNLSANR